jgi:hypothetical protein
MPEAGPSAGASPSAEASSQWHQALPIDFIHHRTDFVLLRTPRNEANLVQKFDVLFGLRVHRPAIFPSRQCTPSLFVKIWPTVACIFLHYAHNLQISLACCGHFCMTKVPGE